MDRNGIKMDKMAKLLHNLLAYSPHEQGWRAGDHETDRQEIHDEMI